MNKSEMIEHIANTVSLSKADAERALNAFMDAVTHTLKAGEQVVIAGFGTFKVSHRAARPGRNPQTGETISIAASDVPVFKAGKHFKDEINENK